ncbi:MAG: YbbR-like domain-containing protein, partial [Proteobacteria bacterium]|nr:YbbR-like domain-containing protein [Pseudomonadota bacterium]
DKIGKFNTDSLTDIVSKDWLLKFISLILAVILWNFVGGEDRVDKNVMIPIEIINLPRDLVISNQFKKEIEVTVSGPRSLILDMTSRAITRQVDLSSATPGTMVFENDNDHIPVPRGIEVQRVQPSSIILSLDKLIQKQFPISARTVGKVADGYLLKVLKMNPDVITITGPLTILSQLDELFTKEINLTGVKQSVQLQVPLELDPAIVELIGETSVTADLTIGMESQIKTLDSMTVHAVVDGVKRQVVPEEVTVAINVPKKLLAKKIKPESLVTVTATEKISDNNLRVQVIPRADVEMPIEVVSIIPDQVSLVDVNLP